jgi:hypothetical protein
MARSFLPFRGPRSCHHSNIFCPVFGVHSSFLPLYRSHLHHFAKRIGRFNRETQVRKKGRHTTYAVMAEITGGELDFSSYVSTTMDRARGERDNIFRSTIRQFVEYK